MATLKVMMPDGSQKSMDIGDMSPDDPRVEVMADKLASTPTEQPGLRQRVGSAVQTGLDYTTKGVAQGAKVLSTTSPEGMSLQEPMMQPGPEREAGAAFAAKAAVPQTPQDLLTAMTLGATNKISGVGGALARMYLTAGSDVAGRYLTGEEQNPLMTGLKVGAVGAAEGAGALGPQFSKVIRDKQKEMIGRRDAAQLGEVFAKHTNLQNLTTPESLANSLSGSKYINTPISKVVSANIDGNEKALLGAVKQAVRTAPPQNVMAARTMLEKTADVNPKNPMGFRGKDAPVIQRENTPDQLVEMTIDRLRHIREKINHSIDEAGTTGTVGVSTHDLSMDYDRLKDEFLSGLGTLHPSLKDAYQKMNEEYIRNLDLAKFLYKGREEILGSGQHSAKLLTPGLGEYTWRTVHDIRDKNLVADILKITTRGGEFGAADQQWSLRPIVRGPKTGGSTIGEAINIQGQTPASPRITSENMPPQGVYDIGALQGLMVGEDEYKKRGK